MPPAEGHKPSLQSPGNAKLSEQDSRRLWVLSFLSRGEPATSDDPLQEGGGFKGKLICSVTIFRLCGMHVRTSMNLEESLGPEYSWVLGQEMLETSMAFCQRQLSQGKRAHKVQLFSGLTSLEDSVHHSLCPDHTEQKCSSVLSERSEATAKVTSSCPMRVLSAGIGGCGVCAGLGLGSLTHSQALQSSQTRPVDDKMKLLGSVTWTCWAQHSDPQTTPLALSPSSLVKGSHFIRCPAH